MYTPSHVGVDPTHVDLPSYEKVNTCIKYMIDFLVELIQDFSCAFECIFFQSMHQYFILSL